MSRKVGVIIPSYNQGQFIEAAICSVVENKKHIDMAIAVIDGGSTDETKSIILKYEEQIDVWCSEADNGQANAINKGIKALVDCEYYMWLNSDDVYEDEYAVSKLVSYAEEHEYEVCYGLSHFINDEGIVIGEYPVEEYCYNRLGNRCFLSQPSVMFSRKAYENVGELDESLKMCMDYEYWMRLAQKYEFGFLREYIGSTRMYEETKTSTMQKQHLNEAISILMRYYGKVPMHWVVTKILADNPNSLFSFFPRRLLMLFFLPCRKRVIRICIEGDIDDKNVI